MLTGNGAFRPSVKTGADLGTFIGVVMTVAVIAGCNRQSTQAPKPEPASRAHRAAVLTASQILARGNDRGIENEWLAIEERVPGFGGLSIDAAGEVRIWLKSLADSSATRTAMASFLRQRPDMMQRRFRFLQGKFAFSELVSWSEAILPKARATGIKSIDADESSNRVTIGVSSVSAEAAVLKQTRQLGIPDSAIAFDVMPGAIMLVDSVTRRSPPSIPGVQPSR